MTQTFKLPEQKTFPTERIDAWCRELTDLTGFAVAVWNGEGQFWMPVGFASTLTGLVVGSESLRGKMQGIVQAAWDEDARQVERITDGLEVFAVPVRQRRHTVCVLAAVVALEGADGLDAELAEAGGVDPNEAEHRLSGEQRLTPAAVRAVAGLIESLGSERVRRLDAEDELGDVSRKLSEGYEEITIYQRIASKVRVSQPTESFFLAMCNELLEFLEVESLAAIYRPNTDPQATPHVVTVGQLPLDETCLGALYRHVEQDLMDGREAIIANECESSAELTELVPGIRNTILVPLRQGETLYGVIAAFNKDGGDEFYSTDVKLVSSISGTIAVFVENSHLYDDLHQLMLGTIKALVSSIDAKDPYTCGHSERVAMLSQRIAERMGVPDDVLERVYLAGLLHDIGKIGVPEAVLLKKGRLTEDEFALMKNHPKIGARILAGVRELESVIPGVLHHHERLDGRGYPSGLNEKEMPLESRIIGLADAFDAMTSNRIYRNAMPLEKVEAELRRCTGLQFDVRCVDALLEIGLEAALDGLPTGHSDTAVTISRNTLRR